MVGVGSYDSFPPEVKKLPSVGALLDPNVELMLSLKPQMVVVYGSQVDLKQQLARAGIGVFDYKHAGLADVTTTIRALGQRTGTDGAGGASWRAGSSAGSTTIRLKVKDRAAAAHAARVRSRAAGAARPLRERRHRLPQRHARDRGRRQRVRRREDAGGPGEHGADPGAPARRHPRRPAPSTAPCRPAIASRAERVERPGFGPGRPQPPRPLPLRRPHRHSRAARRRGDDGAWRKALHPGRVPPDEGAHVVEQRQGQRVDAPYAAA